MVHRNIRPDGLGDDEWAAILDAENRLHPAKSDGDLPLLIGCAKDLIESVAKVVIAERGEIASDAADIHDVVTRAHRCLEFQPGEGLAADPETRKIAQGLKAIAIGVAETRNRYGTGHGRAILSDILDEHAEIAYSAAMLWSGWALRRLEPYIAGDVTALIRDLEGEIFRRGDLAKRLSIANVPRLSGEDQARLGIAVGRRGSRLTFVVIEDGIEAIQPDDEQVWPSSYVRGVVRGLLLDERGQLDISRWKVREAGRLLSRVRDGRSVLEELVTSSAGPAPKVSGMDDDARREIHAAFAEASPAFGDPRDRALWDRLRYAVVLPEDDAA